MKRKLIICSVIGGIVLLVLGILPFIVNSIYYYIDPPIKFFDVKISVSDILNYYAQFMTLLSTLILGVIAIYQTYANQKKSDEINQLQLDIANRELQLAEREYEKQKKEEALKYPKFEVKLSSYNGSYMNLNLEIKNISTEMISKFSILKFLIYQGENIHTSVTNWKVDFRSMKSGEIRKVEICTPSLDIREYGKNVRHLKDVKFVWKFSCEDESGKKHFYAASVLVPDTNSFVNDYWDVDKIA